MEFPAMKPAALFAFALSCVALATGAAFAADPPVRPNDVAPAITPTGAMKARPIVPPDANLSWNAPWGEPRAVSAITVDCADTSDADTLYMTLRSDRSVVPLLGVTATLLFEPQGGDSLGSFWDLERGGVNNGSLLIDFDLVASENCSTPWKTLVAGRVGYSRVGGRGRLDVSADVPRTAVFNMNTGNCYILGRITLRRLRGKLAGCRQPMRVSWIGGIIRSTRPGSESLALVPGPGRSVTQNAPRSGIACRRTRLAVETWTPRLAPPSWSAMPVLGPSGAGAADHK
jgi:hypothetical protein